jgi:hypothetical protein
VRGQDDGRSSCGERSNRIPGPSPRCRVESGGRLVEEQQLGVADDSQCKVEAPSLPTRQAPDSSACLLRQVDGLHGFDHRHRFAVWAPLRRNGFGHRELVFDPALLQDYPDPVEPGRLPVNRITPQDLYLPAIGASEPLDHLDRRGLPGAVRPQDGDDLPLRDLERDAVDSLDGSVGLG